MGVAEDPMVPQARVRYGLAPVVWASIMVLETLIPAAMKAQISTKKGSSQSFTIRTIAYKVVGNCTLSADVYRSPDNRVRPLIFWIHGGALIGGYRRDINREQLQRYIDAGFVVMSIDYRLSPETK